VLRRVICTTSLYNVTHVYRSRDYATATSRRTDSHIVAHRRDVLKGNKSVVILLYIDINIQRRSDYIISLWCPRHHAPCHLWCSDYLLVIHLLCAHQYKYYLHTSTLSITITSHILSHQLFWSYCQAIAHTVVVSRHTRHIIVIVVIAIIVLAITYLLLYFTTCYYSYYYYCHITNPIYTCNVIIRVGLKIIIYLFYTNHQRCYSFNHLSSNTVWLYKVHRHR